MTECDCGVEVVGTAWRELRGPHHLTGCALQEPATPEGRAIKAQRLIGKAWQTHESPRYVQVARITEEDDWIYLPKCESCDRFDDELYIEGSTLGLAAKWAREHTSSSGHPVQILKREAPDDPSSRV